MQRNPQQEGINIEMDGFSCLELPNKTGSFGVYLVTYCMTIHRREIKAATAQEGRWGGGCIVQRDTGE